MRKLMIVKYDSEKSKKLFLGENKLMSVEDRIIFAKNNLNDGTILLVPNGRVDGIDVEFLDII